MPETALAVSNEQMALVKRTIAQGASDEELRLFLYDCERNGVHPLDRLLHFTKRGGRYTPITSIDLMRTRAADTGECAGIDDAEFPPDDDGLPKWAKVTVYRLVAGQRYAYTATARWTEYYPGDGQGHMWRKMPHTMLGKCAEALALRKAFPKQLAGLYAREEMDQADRLEPKRTGRQEPPQTVEAVVVEAQTVREIGTGPAEPKPDTAEAADKAFPKYDPETEERAVLVNECARLAKILKLSQKDKDAYKTTYLGGKDVLAADLSAVAELVAALKARAGEAK